MRNIIIAILLLCSGVADAQYYGMDSVRFGANNIKALVYPAAANRVPGKKYALMIHHSGRDQYGTQLTVLFQVGFPRQVANNVVQGTIADSIIHVCPLPSTIGGNKTPAMFNQIMDWALSTLPIDTTKLTNGMYKYVCVGGLSEGANNAWDNLAWYTTGSGTLKYTLKISHAYFASIPNLFPASQAYANYVGTNTKFFFEQNTTNPCCTYSPAQTMSNTLNAQGSGTRSTFKLINFLVTPPSTYNGHDNNTWDSIYSPRGLDSANNIYLWLLGRTFAPPSTSIKIQVYESSMYDLSGRIMHKDRPWNYFDGNGSVDPKNGDVTFQPLTILDELGKPKLIRGDTTNPIPNSGRDASYFYGASSGALAFAGYYFPGKRGRCIIVDLQNDPSVKHALITHGKKFNITDIYGWERNFEANDSLFFYNFDKVIEETDPRKIPYMINRPDSCLTPFAILVTTGGTASVGAWDALTVNDSMRYVMIRNTLQQRSGYTSTATYNELVFYGTPRGDTTAAPSAYSGPLPKQKTLYEKSGVNTGIQIDTVVMGIVKNIRQYVNIDWYDTDTVPANKYKQLFNADFFPGYKAWNQWWTPHGYNHWLAPFGASRRAGKEATNVIPAASVRNNIDSFRTEPGDWAHYVSHGRLFYQLAYKWGFNTGLDGTKYRWFNDATLTGYGQRWHPFLEFGNEDDTYEPPGISAAKLIMAVNGNKNYFGDTLGVVNSDPFTKLIPAGQTYPDTFRIRTVLFLSYVMMKDTTPRLMDIFSYHSYSRTLDTVGNILGPTFDEQIGNRGLIPELNDWYRKSDLIGKYIWKITGDTSVKSWNTEYGWDNYPNPPTTVGQVAALKTTTGTPLFTGYDSVQSKSIAIMRIELAMGASSLDGFTEFNAHNSNLDQTNNVNLNFYTCGWGGGTYALSTKFPNYWCKKWFYSRMGNYYIDTVISSNTSGLWIMKWRKEGQQDSVMYAIWKGSQNGSTLPSQSVPIRGVRGGVLRQEIYNFGTLTSDVTNITGAGGTYTMTANEMPTFLFAQEVPDVGVIRINWGRVKVVP